MQNDPYSRGAPGLATPASNLVQIIPNDFSDLPVGVKALRIFNPGDTAATVKVTTLLGVEVTLSVRPDAVSIEPLRVARVWATGTTATVEIHGYTDRTQGEWTPLALGGAVNLFWDAEDLSSLELSGSQVANWHDQVLGMESYQVIGGSRPIFSSTSFNGRPGITFDGIDDYLETSYGGDTIPGFHLGAEPGEIWILLNQPLDGSVAGTRRALGVAGGVNTNRAVTRISSGGVNRAMLTGGRSGGITNVTNTTADFSENNVARAVYTGTEARIDVNGIAGTPAALVPTSAATYATIGSNSGTNQFWPGAINAVLVTNPLTDVQATLLLNYLKARGGIA